MLSADFLIFDFDGVLSDSLDVACEVFNSIAARHFPLLPRVGGQTGMAHAYSGLLRTSLQTFGLTDGEARSFFDMHSEAMSAAAYRIDPFHEVIEAIAMSFFGRAAIVTSSYSATVEVVLNKSPFYSADLFTAVIGRESPGNKSRKIVQVLERAGVTTDQALYIGDTVSDLLYCREVPIRMAAVGYGYHPMEHLAPHAPDITIPDIDEMVRLLARLRTAPLTANKANSPARIGNIPAAH